MGKLGSLRPPPPDSSDSPASASRVAGITDYRHVPPRPANFVYLVEMKFLRVGLASLELLSSSEPAASASQSAVITGISHMSYFKLTCKTIWIWVLGCACGHMYMHKTDYCFNLFTIPGFFQFSISFATILSFFFLAMYPFYIREVTDIPIKPKISMA